MIPAVDDIDKLIVTLQTIARDLTSWDEEIIENGGQVGDGRFEAAVFSQLQECNRLWDSIQQAIMAKGGRGRYSR